MNNCRQVMERRKEKAGWREKRKEREGNRKTKRRTLNQASDVSWVRFPLRAQPAEFKKVKEAEGNSACQGEKKNPRRKQSSSEEVMNMLSGDDTGRRSRSLEAAKSSH